MLVQRVDVFAGGAYASCSEGGLHGESQVRDRHVEGGLYWRR